MYTVRPIRIPPMGFAKISEDRGIIQPVQPVMEEVPIELEPVFGYRSWVRKSNPSLGACRNEVWTAN